MQNSLADESRFRDSMTSDISVGYYVQVLLMDSGNMFAFKLEIRDGLGSTLLDCRHISWWPEPVQRSTLNNMRQRQSLKGKIWVKLLMNI